MTTDHHPEELVDCARHGALDPYERAILDRHLANCAACAGHLAQAPRFKRELAPRPRDRMLDRRAVEAAMRRMQRSFGAGRRRRWPRWLRLAAAGVLLASGVTATAAIVGGKISWQAPVGSPIIRPVESRAVRSRPPAFAATPTVPVPADVPRPRALPARASPFRPSLTAAELFDRAGNLRREGRGEAAVAAYRRLEEAFPDAREARLSFALAGQLLLERGQSGDALAQFDRHLKIGGEVGEEALVGRAAALEKLQRTADAIAAWKSLLERYPGSVYAQRARARLAALIERR